MITTEKHNYHSSDVTVTFDPNRCNHLGYCVKHLPNAFNPEKKPWINLERADVEDVIQTVEMCPTGALQYERHDGGPGEVSPELTTIRAVDNGPLFVHGHVQVVDNDGQFLSKETRVALCRCGCSDQQPFCDGTHKTL
ncbi:(4Fe-4S)-binding protein [Tuberibacillus sp. Marseille-P3662]|uniref:(4Fe-4S)-binding protein n=1 Tax=Tuberibacillus sp. Marseille-P3662 TaxID=1965358 RepID=UPI001594B269|nr:(4Fe-4S)-binding protein [Tuberibacillus sp. Marseille-P3662]